MGRSYKLDELAKAAGVSARTVRYYVQRGLLPPPPFRGPDTSYDSVHLARLKKIRALQERHLPLDEIQVFLDSGKEVPAAIALAPEPPSMDVPYIEHRYARVVLAPGLELHLDEGASSSVRELAQRLISQVKPSGGAPR